ncbi:hypothetical protein LV779_19065 [Streptomyces thinghirensis]|nr:hypothetical protein [Streptomyces thinghirensis]
MDPAGTPVLSVGSLKLRPLTPGAPGGGVGTAGELYSVDWTPVSLGGRPVPLQELTDAPAGPRP